MRKTNRIHLWLIHLIGVIVPQRLRTDWRQEWEAELLHHESLLTKWRRADWHDRWELLRHSAGAFADALWLQPRRWEDEMMQDLRFGMRMLLKHKLLTLVAVLSLGLSIGATSTIYALV